MRNTKVPAVALASALWSVALSLGVGCGATPPPRELVDARMAYERAAKGPARELVPADLHTAKTALDRAEAAFEREPSADATRDLAYIAQRKALATEALAGQAAASRDRERAQRELQDVQSNYQRKVEGQLSQTREQLAAERQALQAERQARLEAEKKAREAMDRLASVAAVKQETRGVVITLSGSVLFASGKFELLGGAQEKLNQVADALKTQGDHDIVVEGHTDSQGNENSNMELSRNRAESVRSYLISRGIPSEKIRAVGIGQSRPVADNKTPEGRANNRRVEIIVQPSEPR